MPKTTMEKAMKTLKTGKVGRPKKEVTIARDEISDLKAKLQFHMLQSALRYIALQQMNRGIDRLHKKIDRLRREAENKEVMYRQVAASAQKMFGACMRGEVKPGHPVKVVGPGAQDFVNGILHECASGMAQHKG